jgi:CelD/BcsL family acetyltransferase involved in cellulose biosynthesis
MIKVREINQIEDLGELRACWQELLSQTPSASFFHSLEWLECYWRNFSRGQHFRVLLVTDRQQAVGILPLVVRSESTRVGQLRILTYPLQDWSSFFGPIGPNPSATLLAALRHVRQTPRSWDVLDLRWIDVDRTDLGRTQRAMAQAGFPPYAQKWDRTSLVEFPDTWHSYWHGREGKFRKNIDRLHRRMTEMGRVRLVRLCADPASPGKADPRWDLYDTCVALAQRSWQGTRGDKTNLCDREVGRFLRDVHAAATASGAVDLCLLYFDDEPAAFMYNYRWHGTVYGLRRGFDPRFRDLRPGLVLHKLMLEDGYQRGDRVYDLGTGSHSSKLPWRTGMQTSYRFSYFASFDFRAQLLKWSRWLRRCVRGEQDIACSQVV